MSRKTTCILGGSYHHAADCGAARNCRIYEHEIALNCGVYNSCLRKVDAQHACSHSRQCAVDAKCDVFLNC
eukprot:1219073-Pleurochrysis_carterae.AAC.1